MGNGRVDDITGRVLAARVLSAGVLALALALIGCAQNTDAKNSDAKNTNAKAQESTQDTAAASLLPPAEGKTTYPLTLTTPFGDTELKERPERIAIVTAASTDSDAAFALGVKPVFAPTTVDRALAWLTEGQAESVEVLWESESGAEVGFEKVAAVQPDLIVTLSAYDTFDQARFDELRKIAPVLYAPQESLSWQEMTRALAAPLDLAAAADEVISDYDRRLAELKQKHPQFAGKSAAFVLVYDQKYGPVYSSTPGSNSAALFRALGFTEPAGAQHFRGESNISDELVTKIDAQFILFGLVGEDPSYFMDAPLVQQIPAVAAHQYATVEATDDVNLPWALATGSALSLSWAAQIVADEAAAVVH